MNRSNTDVRLFTGPEDLARTTAGLWLSQLESCKAQAITVALPGGRIYTVLFRALAVEGTRHLAGLSKVQFFWGDERCVPPTHEESNFRLANENFFRQTNIDPAHIHRIKGEEEPAAAASLAEAELRRAMSCPGSVPVLDYVFLGMGEDGHIASLFPGEPGEQAGSAQLYRPVVGPKPPPKRVTMSYGLIYAAKNVWVLVSGAGKSGALRESLAGRATPLGRVLSQRKHTIIFTDCEL